MDEAERINHDAINTLISLRDAADVEAASLDQGPDYEELREGRQERTYSTMQAVDSTIAEKILPSTEQKWEEDRRVDAAVVIQSHYRGYLDRCKFLELLYDQYEKEEEERKRRTAEQVEEGELLVANHQLEVDIDDAETAARNKPRLYEARIITIQRAWRSYKSRQRSRSMKDTLPQPGNADEPTSPTLQRKNDILNKAQEFVDLKKKFDDVLPYNAHKATLLSDSSSEGSLSSYTANSPSTESLSNLSKPRSSNPFNKTSADSDITLPQLDWAQLESSITRNPVTSARSTASSGKSTKDSHREDVRKRLAMNTPAEGSYGEVYTRAPPKSYRGHNMTMELFVNDCNDEATSVKSGIDNSSQDIASAQQRLQEEATVAYIQAGPIAKRLIEVEKLAEEPSQIARMLGISTFRSQGEVTLTKKRLQSLRIAQLQVVFNAMQNEIERLNEELVEIVVTRDELHMQQDSILVNIEDLERRIKELSKKHEKKVEHKQARRTPSATREADPPSAASRMSRLFRLGKT